MYRSTNLKGNTKSSVHRRRRKFKKRASAAAAAILALTMAFTPVLPAFASGNDTAAVSEQTEETVKRNSILAEQGNSENSYKDDGTGQPDQSEGKSNPAVQSKDESVANSDDASSADRNDASAADSSGASTVNGDDASAAGRNGVSSAAGNGTFSGDGEGTTSAAGDDVSFSAGDDASAAGRNGTSTADHDDASAAGRNGTSSADRDDASAAQQLIYKSDRKNAEDGEAYTITVTYGPEAGIPDGAELKVSEILPGTEDYETYYKQSAETLGSEDDPAVISFARFFDISILKDGQKFEPDESVAVEISYAEDLDIGEDETIVAVHFADSGTEVIETQTDYAEETTVSFEQGSFSVTGTVSVSTAGGWPTRAGDYILVVNTGNSGDYYAIKQDGTLYPVSYNQGTKKVTFENYNTFSDVDEFIWELLVNNNNRRLFNTDGLYIAPKSNGTILDPGTNNNLGLNGGYITIGNTTNRYYLALDLAGQKITSNRAAYNNGRYSYPNNPATVYFVPTLSLVDNEGKAQFSGRDFDKEYLEKWQEDISTRTPPLSDLDKTAEVYDYANRIYKLNLTASSGVQTFANDIDISFIMDFSNSMLFAPYLHQTEAGAVLRQENLNALVEQGKLDENKFYYIIADRAGTATHYVVYKYDYASDPTSDKDDPRGNLAGYANGKWVYQDASFFAKTRAGVCGYGSIADDNRWRQPNVLPSGNAGNITVDAVDGNGAFYQFYTADDSYYDGLTPTRIYSTEGAGNNRLYYLKDGVKDAIRNLITIALKDSTLELSTKTVRVAYNQFWAEVGERQDFETVTNAEGDDNYEVIVNKLTQGITAGGTRQDIAMNDARTEFDWNSSATKYAILVTDGAPFLAGTSTETLDGYLETAASDLKERGITLITVGVSMGDVVNGNYILNKIASRDANDVPYFYQVEDAEDLKYILDDILRSVMAEATVKGHVEDKIDSAFYPVSIDGTPLGNGDKIDLDGKLTTDTSKPYGVITKTGDTFSVKWSDQSMPWDGWTGSVYVKAKEDFLGGNTINTNNGDALAVADSYTLSGKDASGQTITGTVDLSGMPLDKRSYSLETPHVNVKELALTQNSTEWTVYLGTEVDPVSELTKLFEKIDIREVVSGDTNHMITDKSQMLGGTGENSKTFTLSSLTGALSQQDVTDLLAGESLTYRYDGTKSSTYGHGYVGDIVVSLVNMSGCYNKGNHATEAVGKDAEYMLKVEYQPHTSAERESELDITPDDYHSDSPGAEVPKTGNDMTSQNTHVINVFATGLEITKTDENFEEVLKEAKFTLYRTARSTDDQSKVVSINGIEGRYYPAADLDTSSTGVASVDAVEQLRLGEQYYLVETKEPAGYAKLETPIPVTLTISDLFTPKPGTETQTTRPQTGIYDWIQTAVLQLGPDELIRRTNEDGSEVLSDTEIDPVTGNTIFYYRIANKYGVELPHTGGSGTIPYTLAGLALIMAAGLMYSFRIRQKGGDSLS